MKFTVHWTIEVEANTVGGAAILAARAQRLGEDAQGRPCPTKFDVEDPTGISYIDIAQLPPRAEVPHCDTCGSANTVGYGNTHFDPILGIDVLASVHDGCYCERCDSECGATMGPFTPEDAEELAVARGMPTPTFINPPPPLTEEAIVAYFRQRIADGNLDAEDIPVRLARYGMMDPIDFDAEMRERCETEDLSQWVVLYDDGKADGYIGVALCDARDRDDAVRQCKVRHPGVAIKFAMESDAPDEVVKAWHESLADAADDGCPLPTPRPAGK